MHLLCQHHIVPDSPDPGKYMREGSGAPVEAGKDLGSQDSNLDYRGQNPASCL